MLDAAVGVGDLVGAHGGVADEDHLVVRAELAQQLPGGGAFRVAPAVVLPESFVNEIVEVVVLHVLEFVLGGGEQPLAGAHVVVHGAADIQQQQDFHPVAPFRAHLDIEIPGVAGGLADGAVEVELIRYPFPGETAQPTQRHLHVAGAQFLGVVQVLVFPFLPHLHGAALAPPGVADAHPFRVVAAAAEGRGAAGADPLVAAVVLPLLLLEPLLQRFQHFVQAAERLDQRFLLLGQLIFQLPAQPVVGNLGQELVPGHLDALKELAEHPVEAVEVFLVLHQGGAGEVVETIYRRLRHLDFQPLQKHQELPQGDRHPGFTQFEKKRNQHEVLWSKLAGRRRSCPFTQCPSWTV